MSNITLYVKVCKSATCTSVGLRSSNFQSEDKNQKIKFTTVIADYSTADDCNLFINIVS
jgi:hypothetical protein